MYIDTKPNVDKKLKLRYSSLSYFQTTYCRDAKYLELLLLAQTLHVSDIIWRVSPDVIIGVRRTNFPDIQFLEALVWGFALNAFLARTPVKRNVFIYNDEGASGPWCDGDLYTEKYILKDEEPHGSGKNKNPAIRLSLKFDLPNRAACRPPPWMWRSASASLGILSIEITHVALPD
jgi:hypothetical protein